MLVVWVALAAFIGGLLSALLGWTQSGGPFVVRKFAASAIASFFGAGIIAVGYNYIGVDSNPVALAVALFSAMLSGAGVSSTASRISGSIRSG